MQASDRAGAVAGSRYGEREFARRDTKRNRRGCVRAGTLDARYHREPPRGGLVIRTWTRILDRKDGTFCKGTCTATGHVGEVVYLGAATRYVIDLDVGGQLVVNQQNLATSSMEALRVRGKRRHRRASTSWDA